MYIFDLLRYLDTHYPRPSIYNIRLYNAPSNSTDLTHGIRQAIVTRLKFFMNVHGCDMDDILQECLVDLSTHLAFLFSNEFILRNASPD